VSEIDPKLSRIYREASSEGPPAAVDAAILAAARKQLAQPQRREGSQRQGRSSWLRWMAPASAIATLVLGVSIAFLVERDQPETSSLTSIRQIPLQSPSAPAADVTESAKTKAADSAAPAGAAKTEAPAPAVPAQVPVLAAPAPVPKPAASTPPAAESFPAKSRAKTAESKATAPKAATESNAISDSALSGAGAGASAAPAAAPAAPAAAGKLAPLRQQAIQRSPEAWLDEIGRLKREGRDNEATEQLAQFRKAYPAYVVPEVLLR
jgi:hypothetical protein